MKRAGSSLISRHFPHSPLDSQPSHLGAHLESNRSLPRDKKLKQIKKQKQAFIQGTGLNGKRPSVWSEKSGLEWTNLSRTLGLPLTSWELGQISSAPWAPVSSFSKFQKIERLLTLVGLLGGFKGVISVKGLAQGLAHGSYQQYLEQLLFFQGNTLCFRARTLNLLQEAFPGHPQPFLQLWRASRLACPHSVLGALFLQRAHESLGAKVVCIFPCSQEPPALDREHNGCWIKWLL